MNCSAHYRYMSQDGNLIPCGKCISCRINKKSVWTTRILMEARSHTSNAFLTLTFSEQNLPFEIQKRDLQLFFKRLRKNSPGMKHRYFACGEYGKKKGRPHYHVILFGYAPRFKLEKDGHYCDPLIQKSWQLGFTNTKPMKYQDAAYVASYTTKKLSPSHYLSTWRTPEFSLSSKNSAIGQEHFLSLCTTRAFTRWFSEDTTNRGIPSTVMLEKKRRPVGRFLQNKISELTGIPVMPYHQDPDKVLIDLETLQIREQKIIEREERKNHATPF